MNNVLNMVSEDTFTEQTDEIVSAINDIGGGGLLPLICTMTLSGNTLTGDKNFAEIKSAADVGRTVVITYDIEGGATGTMYLLEIVEINNTYIAYYVGSNGAIESVGGDSSDYPTVTIGE